MRGVGDFLDNIIENIDIIIFTLLWSLLVLVINLYLR
jgi:hypothetical protein